VAAARVVESSKPKQVGRPRSESARERILVAARELLDERGLRAMTIEAIAERAGTSKVTVYRWWSHKAAVVLDAMLAENARRAPVRERASPLESLRDQMRSFARFLGGRNGRLLAFVVAEGVLDADVGDAYRERWVKPRRDEARSLLRRALEAGELREGTDLEVTLDALFGPIYLRCLIKHAALSVGFADAIFHTVIAAVASPEARARLGSVPPESG